MLISQPQILLRRVPWMSLAASMCGRIGSLFPKVLCSSLLTWSIYAFVLSACYETLISSNTSTLAGFSLGAVGIILYVLSIYTYFKVVNAGSGSPLDFEELKIRVSDSSQQPTYNSANPYDTEQPSVSHGLLQNAEDIEEDRSIPTEEPPRDIMTQHTFKSGKKNFRYCNKCRVWKPDRCHHCSNCKRCVLKMDHHCPWFATCVGFYNHKFFVQFLLYTTVYAGFVFFVTLYLLWGFFTDERYLDQYLSLQLVFLFVLSLVFFISLLVFSTFSIYLLLKNLTTIEFQEQRWNTSNTGKNFSYEFDSTGKKKDLGNIFDLGSKENWCSVMGDSWIYWLLPITITSRSVHSTMKNGINYRINQNTYEKWCRNAELQNQLNKQLDAYRKRVRMDREATQEMV